MSISIKKYILLIIIITHIVGFLGFNSKYESVFLELTPIHLIFTFILISLYLAKKEFLLIFSVIFSLTFIIECIGVNTGLLFGEYYYGDTLGYKLFKTPIIIGLNWIILIIASRGFVNRFTNNNLLQIIFSSLIMVLLDFLIEPVAIRLNFWTWENNIIPIQNYLMWFLVAFVMQWIISYKSQLLSNKLSFVLLLSQFLFFVNLVEWNF